MQFDIIAQVKGCVKRKNKLILKDFSDNCKKLLQFVPKCDMIGGYR